MGKNKNVVVGPQMSVTLRQASTGKKHTNVKSSLKLQHLKNLAIWATQDAAIPSLGAFFSHHFAASSEALVAPVDPSLLTCQRCESILQPGYNCTIRIEKNKKNARHKGKKATNYPQNNIVYTCNFCSHRNMKKGTPRNTNQPKVKPHPKSTNRKTGNTVSSSAITKDNTLSTDITTDKLDKGKMGILEINETLKVKDESVDVNTIVAPGGFTPDDPKGKTGNLEIIETFEVKNDAAASVPVTPLTKSTLTLLELKMKKRNRSGTKKKVAHENSLEASNAEKSSKKRRRKSWTSLKEIAERDDDNRNKRLMNLTVPFSSFDV